MFSLALRWVITLPCVLAIGCSLTSDADRQQCAANADCINRGTEFTGSVCVNAWCEPEPKWGCLNALPPTAALPGPFHVTLRVEDILTQQPMVGVAARLCRKLDVNCDKSDASPVMSDENGMVSFEVSQADVSSAFSGYVLFTREDILSGLYFFNPPIERDVHVPAVQLLTPKIAESLTGALGFSYQKDRGLVLLSTIDCQGQPASGVSFRTDEVDDLTSPFYSVGGLPAASALATDPGGYGGLINVVPGTVSVTGQLAADRRAIGTISLLVKPASITYSRMVPLGA